MSIPAATAGTPSRSSCRLKSSVAGFFTWPPLDSAHETARIEDVIWIEGSLERAHDWKAGRRRSPDVERRLDCGRGGQHHDLALRASGRAQLRKSRARGVRGQPHV